VAHVVRSELYLIAFFCRRIWRRHYTRIVDKEVESRFARFEGIGRRGNGGEGCEVQREVDDFAGIGDL
jgi:hypothetical protein